MQFLGGESKILSHVKFIQIISTLGFQETSAQRTNCHQEQEHAHVLHEGLSDSRVSAFNCIAGV